MTMRVSILYEGGKPTEIIFSDTISFVQGENDHLLMEKILQITVGQNFDSLKKQIIVEQGWLNENSDNPNESVERR